VTRLKDLVDKVRMVAVDARIEHRDRDAGAGEASLPDAFRAGLPHPGRRVERGERLKPAAEPARPVAAGLAEHGQGRRRAVLVDDDGGGTNRLEAGRGLEAAGTGRCPGDDDGDVVPAGVVVARAHQAGDVEELTVERARLDSGQRGDRHEVEAVTLALSEVVPTAAQGRRGLTVGV